MKIRILLVDDDRKFMEKCKGIWEKENKDVEVVLKANPSDALRAIEEMDFDCVVADYDIPEMNGLKFFKNMRDKDNCTPFVLLLSIRKEDLAINALNRNVDGLLKKELHPKMLFEKIIDSIFEKSIV